MCTCGPHVVGLGLLRLGFLWTCGLNWGAKSSYLYLDLMLDLHLTLRTLEELNPIPWDKYLLLIDRQTWESSQATRFHFYHVLYSSWPEACLEKFLVVIETSLYDIAYHLSESLISCLICLLLELYFALSSHLYHGLHHVLDFMSRDSILHVSFPARQPYYHRYILGFYH